MGLLSLNQTALDGTRVRANSSRSGTASATTLTQRLAVLDEQIERMMAEADEADRVDQDLFGDRVSVTTLPRELSDVKRRQARLRHHRLDGNAVHARPWQVLRRDRYRSRNEQADW